MGFSEFFVSYLPVFVSSFRKADRANFDRRYQTRTSDRATQMSANTAKAETEKEIAPVIDPFRYMRGFLTSRFSAIRTDQKIVKSQRFKRFMFNHVQQIGRIVIEMVTFPHWKKHFGSLKWLIGPHIPLKDPKKKPPNSTPASRDNKSTIGIFSQVKPGKSFDEDVRFVTCVNGTPGKMEVWNPKKWRFGRFLEPFFIRWFWHSSRSFSGVYKLRICQNLRIELTVASSDRLMIQPLLGIWNRFLVSSNSCTDIGHLRRLPLWKHQILGLSSGQDFLHSNWILFREKNKNRSISLMSNVNMGFLTISIHGLFRSVIPIDWVVLQPTWDGITQEKPMDVITSNLGSWLLVHRPASELTPLVCQ